METLEIGLTEVVFGTLIVVISGVLAYVGKLLITLKDFKIRTEERLKTRSDARGRIDEDLSKHVDECSEKHDQVIRQLTELRVLMEKQSADTEALKTDVAVLKTDVAQLKTDVAVLKEKAK